MIGKEGTKERRNEVGKKNGELTIKYIAIPYNE
jgi:hypothetical protein